MTGFNKFIDGVDFVPAESDWTPHTTSQLLGKLNVRGRPRDVQRRAVASWLEANKPAPFLRMCLEDDGFLKAETTQPAPRHSAA
jgi:hypothetical protein